MKEPRFDIEHVAKLTFLGLTEEELPRLRETLENSVEFIATVNELDLEGVEPTFYPIKLDNVWREDKVEPSFGQDRMLANAPAMIAGDLIRVPQTLPGEES